MFSSPFRKISLKISFDSSLIPYFFLNFRCTALNKTLLVELGVTHVLNCAQGNGSGFVNTDQDFYKVY